jgi:AcrR family transcriptional regulator
VRRPAEVGDPVADGSHLPDAGRRPLRRDAAANRARILAGALRAFHADGLDVTTEVLARRSGVGVATLYRRFPDRAALVGELAATARRAVRGALDAPAAEPDPARALETALRSLASLRADVRCASAFRSRYPDVVAAHDAEVEGVLGDLLSRARGAGVVRADVSMQDVRLLLAVVDATADRAAGSARRDVQRLVTHFVRSFTGPHGAPSVAGVTPAR